MGTSSCLLGKDISASKKMGIYFPAAINSLLNAGSGFTQVGLRQLHTAQHPFQFSIFILDQFSEFWLQDISAHCESYAQFQPSP